jgi:hypothetical protein
MLSCIIRIVLPHQLCDTFRTNSKSNIIRYADPSALCSRPMRSCNFTTIVGRFRRRKSLPWWRATAEMVRQTPALSTHTESICIVASRPTPEQLSLLVQRLANSLATSPAVGGMVELPSGATNSFNSDSDCSSHSLETAQPSPAPPSKQICIACDISCANLRALRIHEHEFCERELDWFCPDCPDQTFGRQDRLSRHHYDVHSATCHHLLDYCKQVLAKCSRQAAAKKAWGCPCCPRCFETLETWNQHKAIHRTRNGKVENWSFSTMFESLLRHRDLSTVYDRYDWKSRTWVGRGKAECQILRTALERHVLPSKLLSLQTYSGLTLPESLALYAYSLSTPRTIDAAPTIELQIQTAVDPPPFYRDPPVEQCTAFKSIDLNCQPEGHLEAATNLESDEHGRPLSNFVALEEASDQEECDKRILQVRLASSTTKLYIPQGDHESAPQHPQQPNILAAYAASRRNCNRTL